MAKEAVPLRLDKDLMKWVREQAHAQNRSVNNFIETVLQQGMAMSVCWNDLTKGLSETPEVKAWRESKNTK